MLINYRGDSDDLEDSHFDDVCFSDNSIYVSSIYNLIYQELTNFRALNLKKKLPKHLVQHANFKKLNSIDLMNMVVASIMKFYKKKSIDFEKIQEEISKFCEGKIVIPYQNKKLGDYFEECIKELQNQES